METVLTRQRLFQESLFSHIQNKDVCYLCKNSELERTVQVGTAGKSMSAIGSPEESSNKDNYVCPVRVSVGESLVKGLCFFTQIPLIVRFFSARGFL